MTLNDRINETDKMPHSASPSPEKDDAYYQLELQIFLAELAQSPDREAVASEIEGEGLLEPSNVADLFF